MSSRVNPNFLSIWKSDNLLKDRRVNPIALTSPKILWRHLRNTLPEYPKIGLIGIIFRIMGIPPINHKLKTKVEHG